ncbi:conserved hypothetical protein (plasmid) [Desulforapulum autotrophicum HRM2]|uniref:Uncharacterized protein n=1 Tax=Desulforapulum autotrophicum (strain ATCC 43914 / DSM 3382 / VKM B-1955 / HRM2) TaxID=177437 RepID=C0QML3_DESAH|nr:hypothetical protein [Desulforapulum autotrophicum]ACN18007.1 conserved hypothetical protein [Desulforapulum autotrophicum HRM2]
MEKTTMSQKVDVDLAEKFKELQAAAGGTGQDFIETLIATYTQAQVDTDTSSPIYKEQIKVRQSLSQVERVVCAFLELASNDKIAVEEKSKEAVVEAQKKVVELENQIKENVEQLKTIQEEKENLKKQVIGLEEKAESLETLKSAWAEKESSWKEKESGLNTRITELDIEAKQARELSKTVVGLEKELTQKNSALALADQQTKYDQGSIEDLKKMVEEYRGEVTGLRTKLSTAQQDINTVRLECSSQVNQIEKEYASQINKIEKSAAEEKGLLSGELKNIKKQLVESQKNFAENKLREATDKSEKNKIDDQTLSLPGFD